MTLLVLALMLLLALAACGGPAGETPAPPPESSGTSSEAETIDIDLTQLSSTVVYAEVSGMMYDPDAYVGKIVRMRGQCASGYYDVTDTTYYAIIIADATACCAQGIEYVLADGSDYPADGSEAVVTGEFETYDEFGVLYCRLKDATLEQ